MLENRKRRTPEERYEDLKSKMNTARKEMLKRKRAERNKLIKDAGTLLVTACNFSALEDYQKLCSSKEFSELVSAYADSRPVIAAESNVSAEYAAHGDEAFLNSRGIWEYGIVNTHIEFIPVAEGFKNGLEKQNSMNKALKAMGIKNGEQGIYDQWCKREQKRLEEITYEMYADYCAENPDYYRENGDIHIYHPVTEKRRKGGDEKEIFAREQELAEREANVSADEQERDIALIALNQTIDFCEREYAQRKKELDEQEENNKRDAEINKRDAENNKRDAEKNIRDAEKNKLDEEHNKQNESEFDERVKARVKEEVEKIIAQAKADGDYQKANNFQKRLDKTMDLTKNIDTDSEKKIDTSRYDKF